MKKPEKNNICINTNKISNQDLTKALPLNNITKAIRFDEADFRDATIAISQVIAAALGVVAPWTSAAFWIFSSILPLIWKAPEVSSGELWNSIADKIGQQINQAIDKLVIDIATQELEGINDLHMSLNTYITTWNETGTELRTLRAKFYSLDALLISSIPKFAIKGYDSTLLPIYMLAALLHLSLLRTGYEKYED